jgi:hypothetical protein
MRKAQGYSEKGYVSLYLNQETHARAGRYTTSNFLFFYLKNDISRYITQVYSIIVNHQASKSPWCL